MVQGFLGDPIDALAKLAGSDFVFFEVGLDGVDGRRQRQSVEEAEQGAELVLGDKAWSRLPPVAARTTGLLAKAR